MDDTTSVDQLACWCGGGTWSEQFRTDSFGLLVCTGCGSFRIDPPPLLSDDAADGFYTTYYDTPDGAPPGQAVQGSTRSRYWSVVADVPDLRAPAAAALDIGCGAGGLCAELLAGGWPRVVGVEASRSRLAQARQRVPGATFHPTPLEEMPEPPRSFDLAVMDNVIEHLPAPVTTLRSVRPYLRRGGRVVVITPNMESGHFRLLGRRWTQELAPHAHIFLFTEATLRRAVTQAGFEVEHSGAFHLPPHPPRGWLADWRRARARGVAWRGMHELGALYGRLRRAGPMIYVVGRVTESAPDA